MFSLQKQILWSPLAILPWDWAEASIVTALLLFGQDVLEDVYRKFAPSSLEGYFLTKSSRTGIFCCLSFMYILNILTGTVLWAVNHIGSQSSSEHSNSVGQSGLHCRDWTEEKLPMAGNRGWPQLRAVPAQSCSLSCSSGLLKGHEHPSKRRTAAVRVGVSSQLSLWCMFGPSRTNKHLALFPGTGPGAVLPLWHQGWDYSAVEGQRAKLSGRDFSKDDYV